MTTSSPTSSITGLPVLVPGLDRGAERARLQLAAVDGQQGAAADEGGAEVGAAAGREEPGVGAELLVDPVEALGRERRAGRADRLQAAEVAAGAGLDPGLHAGGDVGGAGAEHRHPGALGEVPEHAHVGVARVAVVEDDRGPGQQAGDEEVPHHPAGRGEPEEAVAGVGVDVEVELLQVLEQDAALGLDDRLRQAGRAGGVEDPERVVEGDALEAELGVPRRRRAARPSGSRRAGGRGRVPGRGRGGRRCASGSASPPAAGPASRGGRSPCRRSGSRRPRRAPWARSGRSGRSRWPGRSRASSSTRSRRCSPWRGRRRSPRGCWACRRRRGRRARPRASRRPAAVAATWARSSPQLSSPSSRSSEACRIAASASSLPAKTCSA